LVNLGQAMQAYSVPCWWVGWVGWTPIYFIGIYYFTMKGKITRWSKENLSGVGRILFNRAVGAFQLVALGKFG